jgi:capsule polysaccharide export protein KpsE/RkpR
MTQTQINSRINKVNRLQEKIGEYDEQLTDAELQLSDHSSSSSVFFDMTHENLHKRAMTVIDSLTDKINELEDKVYDIQEEVNDEHPEIII